MATRSKLDDMLNPDGPVSPGYDAWFRAKVERALAEARDEGALIPAEEVWRELGLED